MDINDDMATSCNGVAEIFSERYWAKIQSGISGNIIISIDKPTNTFYFLERNDIRPDPKGWSGWLVGLFF